MRHNPRELTYNEKKAAEAAYLGEEFNSEWGEAARRVYIGMTKAIERQLHFSTQISVLLREMHYNGIGPRAVVFHTAKELCTMFGERHNQNKEG